MSERFFEELSIPAPKYHLGISGGLHGDMTRRMLQAIEAVLVQSGPITYLCMATPTVRSPARNARSRRSSEYGRAMPTSLVASSTNTAAAAATLLNPVRYRF
jgi:hypothetical protein